METLTIEFYRLDQNDAEGNTIFEHKEVKVDIVPSNGRFVLNSYKGDVKQICKKLGGTVSARVYHDGNLLPGDYVLHEETIDSW